MKWKSETVKAKQRDTPSKALRFVDKDYFPSIGVIHSYLERAVGQG